MRRILPLLAVLILGPHASVHAQEATLVVSGTGAATLIADRATVNLAVESRADNAADAGERGARVSERIRAALREAGIDDAAIATGRYNLRPDWRRQDGERVPNGFVAETVLAVDLDDVATTGRVIDAALGAGATRVYGVTFTSSRMDAARQEALALAVRDAMTAAETMAAAAGGRLGTLIELSTEGTTSPADPARPMLAEMRMADAATEITPRDITVHARVVGRWRYASR